jgi:ribonuclease HI
VWVTLYTDASFHPEHGGTWAVWLRCERGRLVRRGACPAWVTGSNAAELAAIYAGVYIALRAWPSEVLGFFVRSDSQVAIAHADGSARPSRDPATRRIRKKLQDAVRTAGVELSCRWVKGHQRASRSTAAYLNNQCDKLSRASRPRSRKKRKVRAGALARTKA